MEMKNHNSLPDVDREVSACLPCSTDHRGNEAFSAHVSLHWSIKAVLL